MALGGGAGAAWADGPSNGEASLEAAHAAVRRPLPHHADQVTLRLLDGTERFGVAGSRGAVQVAGTSPAVALTGPWTRAGIVVRNDLTQADGPGFADLAVTPDNGVVLSYDADGDGLLDTYRRVTGVRAPVLLRLSRGTGSAVTGEFSPDDGATCRTVTTVTLPGAASRQEAGPFMSAANGDKAAPGPPSSSPTGTPLDRPCG